MSYTIVAKEALKVKNVNAETEMLMQGIKKYFEKNLAEEIADQMSLEVCNLNVSRELGFSMQLQYEAVLGGESCIGMDYFIPLIERLDENGSLKGNVKYGYVEYFVDSNEFRNSGYENGSVVSYEFKDGCDCATDVTDWFTYSFEFNYCNINKEDVESVEKALERIKMLKEKYGLEEEMDNAVEEYGYIYFNAQPFIGDISAFAHDLDAEAEYARENGLDLQSDVKFISIDNHSMALADLRIDNNELSEKYLKI